MPWTGQEDLRHGAVYHVVAPYHLISKLLLPSQTLPLPHTLTTDPASSSLYYCTTVLAAMTKIPVSHTRLWLAACVLLAARSAVAQTLVATNFSDSDPPEFKNTSMTISRNDDMVPLAPVIPLTDAATNQIPPTGLSGEVVQVNPDNQYNVGSGAVAFISCDTDDYPGNIDQSDVFRSAADRNVTAVLFYSNQADYCRFDGDKGTYNWVFSMKIRNDTVNVLSAIADTSSPLWVTIGGPEVQQGRGESNGSGDESQGDNNKTDGPLGPNPSTAVAMIILYTITGIITALFLVIIVTGAVRAHRHPERYGPRAVIGMGRPRQSRAKGIGRAILDGIPIVKFGQKEEEVKPADVELGSTSADASTARDANATTGGPTPMANLDGTATEDGIAAAGATRSGSDLDAQGCSICTEDFELGQDQRVLPCDHRFHPECIDPWLLNVSGTCPLCRVDLRQHRSRTSEDLDANGNPINRDEADETSGDLPPPVIAERPSVRRSLMIGVLGIRGRPDQMTREERIVALRRYRQQQASRRRQTGTGENVAADGFTVEDDRNIRRRLRTLLGVRTRRAGQESQDAQGPVDAADGRAEDAR